MDEAYTDDDDTKTGHCVEAKTGHCGEAKTGHCGEAKTGHCGIGIIQWQWNNSVPLEKFFSAIGKILQCHWKNSSVPLEEFFSAIGRIQWKSAGPPGPRPRHPKIDFFL